MKNKTPYLKTPFPNNMGSCIRDVPDGPKCKKFTKWLNNAASKGVPIHPVPKILEDSES